MDKRPNQSSLQELVTAVELEEKFHVSLNNATVVSFPTNFPTQATDIFSNFPDYLYTIHLVTLNDLKSIVVPETTFGIISALSGPLLTTNPSPSLEVVLSRIPHVTLWTYLNLLIFDLANQRLPASVLEDSINKPWRALPSHRLSLQQARQLLLLSIPCVFAATCILGGLEETVMMMVLTWMYNDLHGADEHYLVRNIINAAGFMCYSLGATKVAVGSYALDDSMYQWVSIVGAMVFSTLQMQDMSDQEGDAQRGRGTLPLVWGDGFARWSIAVPVLYWSLVCPAFWQMEIWGFVLPLAVGGLLAGRLLLLRTVKQDKVTWKIWCFWTMTLYALPLCKEHSVFSRAFDSLPNVWS